MATAFKIQEFDDPSYDPFLSDEVNFGDDLNPYPRIHALRARGAVLPGSYRENMGYSTFYPGVQAFTVLGSKEIEQALTDTARCSDAA